MSRLSIDNIVNVNINVTAGASVAENGCNTGLILGSTNPITASVRMKFYSSLDDMLADSFTTSMDEYKAAAIYFMQNPSPSGVYIGKIDLSDEDSPETPVIAYNACRQINGEFYGVYVCGIADANAVALGQAIDTAGGQHCLFFDTDNADALVSSPVSPDVFTAMGTANVKSAIGIYSEADFAGAALMGLACGLTTGAAGSAFDLFLKKLSGITPSDTVTESQLTVLKGKHGNAYITRGQNIKMIENGDCVDGVPYDEKMYLVMTKKVLQGNVIAQMTAGGVPKIPQTDDGMATIVAAVTTGMEYMRAMGFVGTGAWTAPDFRTIKEGDVLSGGYKVFADSFTTLSASDRALRKAPMIYVAMKLAGSIRSVVIGVNVNE